MEKEIKITIDTEKKNIIDVKGTDKVDPISLSKIFTQLSLGALNAIQIKPEKQESIIKPTMADIKKVG
jgi:hypothetical protein